VGKAVDKAKKASSFFPEKRDYKRERLRKRSPARIRGPLVGQAQSEVTPRSHIKGER